MATENSMLMKNARKSLEGNWGLAIGTFLIYAVVLCVVQVIPLAGILLMGPMALGLVIFSLALARGEEAKLEQVFEGFQNFASAMVTYLLMLIYVFLWTLLLIVPGIIAAFSYAMTMFILADEPGIKPQEALDKSKAMMYGYKAKLFRLYLRFFGWSLLCLLTFGIGYLWLIPYMYVTYAKFYEDVKADYNGNVASSEPLPSGDDNGGNTMESAPTTAPAADSTSQSSSGSQSDTGYTKEDEMKNQYNK